MGLTRVKWDEEEETSSSDSISRVRRSMIGLMMWTFVIVLFPVVGWWCVKRIKQDHVLVQHRLGDSPMVKTPGLAVVLPVIDTAVDVDMRHRNIVLPSARYHSKDLILIDAGLVLQYQVIDAVTCVTEVCDIEKSLRLAAEAALPAVLAQNTSDMMQCSMKILHYEVLKSVNNVAYKWGIDISNAEITPFSFSAPPKSDKPAGGVTGIVSFIQKLAGHNSLPPQEEFTMPDLLKLMKNFMTPKLCDKINAVILLNLTGEKGGKCLLDFKTGNCVLDPSVCDPETTIEVDVEKFVEMVNNKVSIVKALKSGDVNVKGDKEIALRLRHLL